MFWVQMKFFAQLPIQAEFSIWTRYNFNQSFIFFTFLTFSGVQRSETYRSCSSQQSTWHGRIFGDCTQKQKNQPSDKLECSPAEKISDKIDALKSCCGLRTVLRHFFLFSGISIMAVLAHIVLENTPKSMTYFREAIQLRLRYLNI